MESLSDTPWDVVISGTGLPQALLALSLSRSGKKVLHVDRNRYYGGEDAALTIQEAEQWVDQINRGESTVFFDARVKTSNGGADLHSRSYALSLTPQIIYAQSKYLQALVTSQVHTQLEFLAVGSWFVLKDGELKKIPSGREDVFADETLSRREKMGLMKFLRHVLQESAEESDDSTSSEESLETVLSTKFSISSLLHAPLLALSLSPTHTSDTNSELAISRIRRHLQSIGTFGAGFGAVLPKYGGNAEIAQVACRASAVGGGVYVLGQDIKSMSSTNTSAVDGSTTSKSFTAAVELTIPETVQASYVVGPADLLRRDAIGAPVSHPPDVVEVQRSISIISQPLAHVFPPTSDGGPPSAVAMVLVEDEESGNTPIYLQIHSEDTAECPSGQCIIYGSTLKTGQQSAHLLEKAVGRLLRTGLGRENAGASGGRQEGKRRDPEDITSRINITDDPPLPVPSQATELWSMSYTVQARQLSTEKRTGAVAEDESGRFISFPLRSVDQAFDDSILEDVKAIWMKIMGEQAVEENFLRFEPREQEEAD